MKNVELKSTVIEMKNSLVRLKNRSELAEEIISKFENRSTEIMQVED